MIKRLTFIAITVVLLFVVVSEIFASPGTVQYLPIVANEPTLTPTNTPTPTPTAIPTPTDTPTPMVTIPVEEDIDLIQEKLYLWQTFGINLGYDSIKTLWDQLGLVTSVGLRETCPSIITKNGTMATLPSTWDKVAFPTTDLPDISSNYYVTDHSTQAMYQLGVAHATYLLCIKTTTTPQIVLLTFGTPTSISSDSNSCTGVRSYGYDSSKNFIEYDAIKVASLGFLDGFSKGRKLYRDRGITLPTITLGIGATNAKSIYCQLGYNDGVVWAQLVNDLITCRNSGCDGYPQTDDDNNVKIWGAFDLETNFNTPENTLNWKAGFMSIETRDPAVPKTPTIDPNYLYIFGATGCPRELSNTVNLQQPCETEGEIDDEDYQVIWTTQQVLSAVTGHYSRNMPQIYGLSPNGNANGWLYVAWAAQQKSMSFNLDGVVTQYRACEQVTDVPNQNCATSNTDNTPSEGWGYLTGTFLTAEERLGLRWFVTGSRFKSVSDMIYQ